MRARIGKPSIVGLLAWVVLAGYGQVSLASEQQTKEAIAAQSTADSGRRAQALQARFRQFDSDQIMAADVLADPARHGPARERLAEFRAMVAARVQLEQDTLADAEQFIIRWAPNETERNLALAVFRRTLPEARARITALASAYAALGDGYQEALDWAAGQAGNLKARDGALVVSQAQLRDAFAMLDKKLADAAAACIAADQSLDAIRGQQREEMGLSKWGALRRVH